MSSETEYEAIRILKEIPEFTGTDLETYGPFEEGNEVEVPKKNAEILVNRGNAEFIEMDEIDESGADDSSPEWRDVSDSKDHEHPFFEMQFEDSVAELYIEEVEVEEFQKSVYIVYFQDFDSGERKEVGVDFNQYEAREILGEYMESRSPEAVKSKIQTLRGENTQ